MTTRGVMEPDVQKIVAFIHDAFEHREDTEYLLSLREKVKSFCLQFPLPR